MIITVDRDATVTLNLYISLNGALPQGFTALSIGASIGYTLDISPSDANLISATLVTPALGASIVNQINAGTYAAGVVQFNSNTKTFNQLEVYFNSTTNTISIPLPSAGTVILVGVSANVPIPSFYSYARTLIANVRTVVNYTGEFFLNVTSSSTTTLHVNHSSSNFVNVDPNGAVSVNAYWQIETSSNTNINAVLSYHYNNTLLAAKGIAADTLQFAYYTSNGWVFDGTSTVDASAGVVSQSSTHFSTWGVFSKSKDSGSSSSSSFVAPCFLLVLSVLAFFF